MSAPTGSGTSSATAQVSSPACSTRSSPAPASKCSRSLPAALGANAYAERWVRTLPSELTDRMLIFGQRNLRHVLAEYLRHYNEKRPHQALNLSPPHPPAPVIDLDERRRIRRQPILGGLINEYERAA